MPLKCSWPSLAQRIAFQNVENNLSSLSQDWNSIRSRLASGKASQYSEAWNWDKLFYFLISWKTKVNKIGCFYVTAILGWVYGWGWVEADVDLNLRLKWSWDEIEWKLSWNWVEVVLSWSWDKLTLNKGRNWAFIGVGLWFKIYFRSTHVAEQYMFYMFPLILASDFT